LAEVWRIRFVDINVGNIGLAQPITNGGKFRLRIDR
jgi:hypothetical protein